MKFEQVFIVENNARDILIQVKNFFALLNTTLQNLTYLNFELSMQNKEENSEAKTEEIN